MSQSQHAAESSDDGVTHVGLIATGRAGEWEVSVDQTTSGSDRWFVQIEGTCLYLHFEIPLPLTISAMYEFLSSLSSTEGREELEIGSFNDIPVALLRDREFSDRYFLCIGKSEGAIVRVSLAGGDLASFRNAVGQVKDELKSDAEG